MAQFIGFLYRQKFVHPPQIPSNISLLDKTILITGANSGIGLEAARQCVKLNAKLVILGVRSISKGEVAKSSILQSNPTSECKVEIWQLDMESFESVISFGKRTQELQSLDIAILNAGVFKESWSTLPDGFESSLQVNHLSTALLSLLILPALKRTSQNTKASSKLTFTSSEVAMWTPFKDRKADNILETINGKKDLGDTMDYYSVTKLLNYFWGVELASRVHREKVIINLFNPGSVDTGLHRDSGGVVKWFDRLFGRSPEEGGRLVIDAAVVKGAESHGKLLSEAKSFEVSSFVNSTEGSSMQKKLWEETWRCLREHASAGELEGLL